jgi:hypothetical protein
LVACASAALEVIGLLRQDKLTIQISDRRAFIASLPHHLWIVLDKADTPRLLGLRWDSGEPIPARTNYLEPRAGHFAGDKYFLAIPHSLIVLLTAPWPAWWFVRQRKRNARRLAGLCQHCGYDLRASPERCPECGATAARGMGNLPMQPAAKQHA